jgi:hypothetical protein
MCWSFAKKWKFILFPYVSTFNMFGLFCITVIYFFWVVVGPVREEQGLEFHYPDISVLIILLVCWYSVSWYTDITFISLWLPSFSFFIFRKLYSFAEGLMNKSESLPTNFSGVYLFSVCTDTDYVAVSQVYTCISSRMWCLQSLVVVSLRC